MHVPQKNSLNATLGNLHESVRVRLEQFINACAVDPHRQEAWAVFDWDHTLFQGDIGDAMFSYLLHHSLLYCPRTWRETSDHLTPACVHTLETLLQHESTRIPASDELRAQMAHVYFHHQTIAGFSAFTGYDQAESHPSYAWLARLCAGFSIHELRTITREVLQDLLQSNPGTEKYGYPGEWYARPALVVMDVLKKLHAAGLCIAVVSASPQVMLESCIDFFNLPVTYAIGVRVQIDANGRLTSRLAPCGRRAGVIPYGRGKRAWISHVIGQRDDPAFEIPDDALTQRIWFAAGDSDGDWAMLQDASRLRWVLATYDNRVVQMARENADGNWLLNILHSEA